MLIFDTFYLYVEKVRADQEMEPEIETAHWEIEFADSYTPEDNIDLFHDEWFWD